MLCVWSTITTSSKHAQTHSAHRHTRTPTHTPIHVWSVALSHRRPHTRAEWFLFWFVCVCVLVPPLNLVCVPLCKTGLVNYNVEAISTGIAKRIQQQEIQPARKGAPPHGQQIESVSTEPLVRVGTCLVERAGCVCLCVCV